MLALYNTAIWLRFWGKLLWTVEKSMSKVQKKSSGWKNIYLKCECDKLSEIAELTNWLTLILLPIYRLIVDLEKEMRCPSLNTLPEVDEIYCMNHRGCHFPSCAVVNVNKLLTWILERRNVFEGGVDDVDQCQCDCPDRKLCLFTVSSDSSSSDEE